MPIYPEHGYTRRRSTSLIVLHHTAGPPDQTIGEIRAFHARPRSQGGRGWIDIGYHFLVRQGEILVGRPVWAIGAHAAGPHPGGGVAGVNAHSVGVALVGTYTEARPPGIEQLDALCSLVADLRARYPEARVVDHRQAMAELGVPGHTTCPGLDLAALVLARLPVTRRLEPDDPLRRDPTTPEED